MARGSGRTSRPSARLTTTANDPLQELLGPVSVPTTFVSDAVPEPLTEVEDSRSFVPDAVRPALEIDGRAATVRVGRVFGVTAHRRPIIAYGKPLYAWRGLPHGVQVPVGLKYESPLFVIKCLRRKMRREVIFALNKREKGAGARRRRNAHSSVSC